MELAWANDLHLTFQLESQKELFKNEMPRYDGLIVCGDISEGKDLKFQLEWLDELGIPIYFVLGNHDFYYSSFKNTKDFTQMYCEGSKNLHYLTASNPIKLGDYTLIGHDAWYDCRLGRIAGRVILRDFDEIKDLSLTRTMWGSSPINDLLIAECKNKADEGTEELINKIKDIDGKIIIATHAPPFFEACRYAGKLTDQDYIPFYCNSKLGNELRSFKNDMIVLAGHTHCKAEFTQDNIKVITGGGHYTMMFTNGVLNV